MDKVKIYRSEVSLPRGIRIIDTVAGSLRELLIVRNPKLKSAPPKTIAQALRSFTAEHEDRDARLIYYPWKKFAIRIISEDIYFELRTARNRNIISKAEQHKYRNACAGIIGLSVGANVLNALVFSGGPKFLRIADFDNIEITNLNRLRAPIYAVGENKAVYAAQQVWELDPFAEIDVWPKGVNQKTIERFITSRPQIDVFVDEMDDLALKITSRKICQKNKIPVVMVTDNGDNVILDVERFDTEPKRPILHGLVEDVDAKSLSQIAYAQWVKIATQIVGPSNLTARMRASLNEIGKTIAAVPQLGTTATIAGAVAAYAIRKISTGDTLKSGRYFISLDKSIR